MYNNLNATSGLVPTANLFEILEVRPHLYVRQQVSDAGNRALIYMHIISPFIDRNVLLTT
jgi:hypothetical protein